MGGLVIRSACFYADAAGSDVLAKLKHVVCLGTPHHGSMVERAGHAFDLAIKKYPYFAPLAVGRHRRERRLGRCLPVRPRRNSLRAALG